MVLHRLRHIPLHVPSLHSIPNHHIHKKQTLVRKTEKGRGVPPIKKKTLQKQTKPNILNSFKITHTKEHNQ